MRNFSLPSNLEKSRYNVFPDSLEEDCLTLFHGTLLENLLSIGEDGFRLPCVNGKNPLRGVSYARSSALALSHAMEKRKVFSGNYCIIAARYPSLQLPHIYFDGESIVHDYLLKPQPELVGFVIIPESYRFI